MDLMRIWLVLICATNVCSLSAEEPTSEERVRREKALVRIRIAERWALRASKQVGLPSHKACLVLAKEIRSKPKTQDWWHGEVAPDIKDQISIILEAMRDSRQRNLVADRQPQVEYIATRCVIPIPVFSEAAARESVTGSFVSKGDLLKEDFLSKASAGLVKLLDAPTPKRGDEVITVRNEVSIQPVVFLSHDDSIAGTESLVERFADHHPARVTVSMLWRDSGGMSDHRKGALDELVWMINTQGWFLQKTDTQ